MENSLDQQEPETQQPLGFFASLQIFDRIEKWLTGLFELTEEEQRQAGVYYADERYK